MPLETSPAIAFKARIGVTINTYVWLVVSIAVVAAVSVASWCGLALAEAVYGYPVGRDLVRRITGRLGEHQSSPATFKSWTRLSVE